VRSDESGEISFYIPICFSSYRSSFERASVNSNSAQQSSSQNSSSRNSSIQNGSSLSRVRVEFRVQAYLCSSTIGMGHNHGMYILYNTINFIMDSPLT
jgi:hypothetical protein